MLDQFAPRVSLPGDGANAARWAGWISMSIGQASNAPPLAANQPLTLHSWPGHPSALALPKSAD